MPVILHPTRPLAALLAAVVLAACQAPGAGPEAVPAERAQSAAVPPTVPAAVDPDACWAQDRIAGADGVLQDRLFAVPCPGVLDAQFWSNLQRALAVRGHHEGGVTGTPDTATRAAIRRFQAPLGLDSPILSLDAARHLGLLPWPRAAL